MAGSTYGASLLGGKGHICGSEHVDIASAGCTYEIVGLQNSGRETESYLWFLSSRYSALADHTLFTQSKPHHIEVGNFTPEVTFVVK